MDPNVLRKLLGLDEPEEQQRDDPVPTTCPECGHEDELPFHCFEVNVELLCTCGVKTAILDTVPRQ